MTNADQTKGKVTKLIAEVDPYELACRILEGTIGCTRPPGITAYQAIQQLPEEDIAGLIRAAAKATEYITECVTKSVQPS